MAGENLNDLFDVVPEGEALETPEVAVKEVETEVKDRINRSKNTLTKLAGFPAIKTIEQFDYSFTIGVNSKQIEELASLNFVKKHENIIFLG